MFRVNERSLRRNDNLNKGKIKTKFNMKTKKSSIIVSRKIKKLTMIDKGQ